MASLTLHDSYQLLMPGAKPERAKEACAIYFKKLSLGPEKLQFGLTKLFLRAGIIAMLESLRTARLNECATRIQKHWRRYVVRKRFVRERRAAVRLQAAVRLVRAREEVAQRRATRAAVALQKHARRLLARLRFVRLRKAALIAQSTFRCGPSLCVRCLCCVCMCVLSVSMCVCVC